MKGILAATIRHNVFVNIMTVLVLIAGVASIASMAREIFPEMSVDMVLVNVIYRGADPTEVEEGVCRKLEEALEGLEGVKSLYTYADEGGGAAVIECLETYDIAKLKENVRDRVGTIMDFPADTENPIVQEITARTQVLNLSLFGEHEERDLKETAERIKQDLLLLPEISQVSVSGVRRYEMSIEVTEERLRQFGLTFAQVTGAVRALSLDLPGGTVKTAREEITVRAVGRRYTAGEFGRLVTVAGPDGASVPLGRFATIRDGFEEEPILGTFNGRRAALIQVFKTPDEDTVSISEAVKKYIKGKVLPPGMKLAVWADTAELVQDRIDLLVRNGQLGFILVFCILWFFLDLRLGFWVSLGIPISLGGAMVVMAMTGQSLNMLSLFGLIMVLGIVVDDAIVVGESIYYHRRRGLGRAEAAYAGVREMALPVIAAVTTTIAAFSPLFFVAGIMGKFIRVIPLAVVAALSASLLECLFLLPAHLNHLPDLRNPGRFVRHRLLGAPARGRRRFADLIEKFAEGVYGPAVEFFVRWRYPFLAGAVAVMLVAAGLFLGGILKFSFFPTEETEFLTARIEFPRGTPLSKTHDAVRRIEKALTQTTQELGKGLDKPVTNYTYAIVGAQSGYENPQGSHLAEVQCEIIPASERPFTTVAFINRWRKGMGEIPGALNASVDAFTPGHFGKAVEVWVLGEDMADMRQASAELRRRLGDMEGVYNIDEDFRPGKREVRLRLRPEARFLGLTFIDVAAQVRSAFWGSEALRVQRGRENLRVYLRYPLEGRSVLPNLKSMRIVTPAGDRVPLESVARFKLEDGYARIVRENGLRRLVVTADVDEEVTNAREIRASLRTDLVPELRARHPGLRFTFEGIHAEQQQSMQSLGTGFAFVGIVIFLILATIFRSYLQPVVILTTVPFGVAGVVFAHLLLGFDMTMMSLFGLVALSGVVVNDAIILIEAVNARLGSGLSFLEAIRAGGVRRFRPVILTTLTTFFGLLPLLTETSMQARFMIPMAIALAFGVAFATLLTLFLLPCELGILNDVRRLAFWLRRGTWPTQEEVEPARLRGAKDQSGPEETSGAPPGGMDSEIEENRP
jgi:multidrug efflux pump subunit AcrB